MTKIVHILGYFLCKFLFCLRHQLHSLENLQKFDYTQLVLCKTHIFGKKKKKKKKKIEKIFLELLDAILDFSAGHQLCQFMPAVSETTDHAKHLEIVAFFSSKSPCQNGNA